MYYITNCSKCGRFASFYTSNLNKYVFTCLKCRHQFRLRQKGSFVAKVIGGFENPAGLNRFVAIYNRKSSPRQ